ncbi:hypothetical protein NDU88_005717 [Pleurodeles waltl]|uniref:Uncharacterized protein n=1 Tax=Pleurodeles waltl TaxID=8319 RepID=A0AAV7MYD2_PLEWA|nr:hypothetical protein NDU88_005717 [Pleurodeles waltl]
MALGLPDPNFSLAKKSRDPPYISDPARSLEHRAGGAHRQAIGEDIRLYARLGGPCRRRVHRVRSKVGPKATTGVNSWKGACTLGQCKPENKLSMNNWGNHRRTYWAPPC